MAEPILHARMELSGDQTNNEYITTDSYLIRHCLESRTMFLFDYVMNLEMSNEFKFNFILIV